MLQLRNLLCNWRIALCATLIVTPLFAAFEFQGIGWPAASADIRVVGPPHLDRLLTNPALMDAIAPLPIFNLQYSRPFAGLDLQAGSVSGGFTIRGVPLVSGVRYFGDEYYSEFNLIAGSSRALSPGFRTGIALNYFRLDVLGFEPQQALTLSLSTSVELTRHIRLGSVVQHVAQAEKGLSIPQRFLLGVDYSGGPLHLLVGIEKEAALPLELSIGVVSPPEQKWQIAFGYRDLSQTLSAGWRFRFKKFGAHYTWLYHPELPGSHGFGLEWSFQ